MSTTWLPPQEGTDRERFTREPAGPESPAWSPPSFQPTVEATPWSPPPAAVHEPTYLRRAAGALVDLVIAVVCFFLPFFVGGLIAGMVGTTEQQDDQIILPIGFVLAGLLVFGLPVAMAARRGDGNGKTLGKEVVGLRAVRLDGGPVGWGTALLRELLGKPLLGMTLLWLVLDAVWPLVDERRQALHDKIASTVVAPAQANVSANAEIAGASTSAGR